MSSLSSLTVGLFVAEPFFAGISGFALVVVLAAVILFVYLLARRGKRREMEDKKPRQQALEKGEDYTPGEDVLDERDEVDEAVEITDDMSLAEVKKAKAAKVKDKSKAAKKKAIEETEEAKKEHVESGDSGDSRDSGDSGDSGGSGGGDVAQRPTEDIDLPGQEADDEKRRDIDFEVPNDEGDEPAFDEVEDEELDDELSEEEDVEEPEREQQDEEPEEQQEDEDEEPKTLETGLEKTREGFIEQLSSLFGEDELDEDIVEDIEEVLFTADVGPRVAQDIIAKLEDHLDSEDKRNPNRIWKFIREYTTDLLEAHESPLELGDAKPFVILVVGVNGVGKTTSIGKMASKFKQEGKSCLLVAGDTFRAGAVDQLEIWGERTGFPVHSGEKGADPSSVLYEGIERGAEEDIDVVLCDTSGRLHTDPNLMKELEKMERVAGKAQTGAPHETMLVLDANTGQNAIVQAEKFDESLDLSGITLTKLDGTAKGGVILGVCDRLGVPIRYIGIGESVADLREFDADEFVEALFM
jgi:fused signal recognition particle receptor